MAFNRNILKLAAENTYFRQVLATGAHSQVVVMSIPRGGEIGMETHHDVDQVLVFVSGEGESILNGDHRPVGPGTLTLVPAGTEHNFRNTGTEDLKLFTVYAPPEHRDGTIHKTRADAEVDTEDHP